MQWQAFILFETLQWPNTSRDMMTGDRWNETVTGLHLKRSYTKYLCYFLKKGSFETKKFKFQDIQIVESQNLNFYFQLLKCQSIKEEIHFTEQLGKSKTSIGKWKICDSKTIKICTNQLLFPATPCFMLYLTNSWNLRSENSKIWISLSF